MSHLMHADFEACAPSLRDELAQCENTAEAANAVGLMMDRIKSQYMAETEDGTLRARASELMAAARAAADLLVSASEADVQLRLPAHLPNRVQKPLDGVLMCVGTAATAVLAVWLWIDGQGNIALYAGVCALLSAISVWITRARAHRAANALPQARGVPRVNAEDCVRRLERLFRLVDDWLEKSERIRTQSTVNAPEWSPAQLDALQMLWEALKTEDGDYALKALPQLMLDLEERGLRLAQYTPETAHDFEDLPGLTDGDTIRPAVYIGSRLAAMGQVTRVVRPRAREERMV